MHVKAYEFNFKPKQQKCAVSSIGVMEDSPTFKFSHLAGGVTQQYSNYETIIQNRGKNKGQNMANYT